MILDYHNLIDGIIINVRIFFLFLFINLANNTPAPNTYHLKDLTGINHNSKYRSGKMISMAQKFRYKDSREKYPGPGQYIRFSEFGILVSKKCRNLSIKTEENERADTSGKMETHAETKQLQTE
jgi:hypothetical protein